MEYGKTNILACIDNTKDACLYFDNVIPLNLAHVIPWENNGDLEAHEVLQNILPSVLLDRSHPLGLSQTTMLFIEAYVNAFPVALGAHGASEEEMDKRTRYFFPLIMKRKDELFAALSEPVNTIFGAMERPLTNSSQADDPALILTGLNLIDTSQIKWRQILEIRKDKDSIGKLRRLRTFVYQNYKDKPISFIQDDLLNKVDAYETTAKHLGLKTKDASFKIIFNSGTLIASTAATILTAFSGAPVTVPLSLGVGSAFMLGNVGLGFRSYKREAYKFKQDNPVTYLVDIMRSEK